MPTSSASWRRSPWAAFALVLALAGEARPQSGWLPTSWFGGAAVDPDAMHPLAEKDGPWLVLATTFRGETARDDARKLARELRGRHALEAYTHEKAFDYTAPQRGVGLNPDGTPKTMRYANARQVVEVAVLVGDFASADDPRGQKTLQKIKTLRPEALGGSGAKHSLVSDFLQANRDTLGSNVVVKSYMPFTDRCDLTAKSIDYLRCIKLKPGYQEALVKQLNQNTFISTKPLRSQRKIQEKHLHDCILTRDAPI